MNNYWLQKRSISFSNEQDKQEAIEVLNQNSNKQLFTLKYVKDCVIFSTSRVKR